MRALWKLLRIAGRPFAYLAIWLMRCPYDAANTILTALFLKSCFQAVAALDTGALYAAVGKYALAFLALYLFNGTVWTMNGAYAARFCAALREKCFAYLSDRSLSEIEARPQADWITRLNGDTANVMGMLTGPQVVFVGCGAVSLAVSSLVMAKADLAMLGVVLLFTVPHVLLSQFFLARPMRALSAAVMQETAEASAKLMEEVECALPMRAYRAEEWMLSRFAEKSEALRKASMRVRTRAALGKGLMLIMGIGGYLAALALGSYAISAGQYDLGTLIGLFQLRGGVLIGSLTLINALLAVRQSSASADRLNDMLSGK